MKLFYYLIIFVLLLTAGCVPKRKMVYLQSEKGQPPLDSIAFNYDRSQYRLQVNDIIDVQITSPDEEINRYFSGQGGGQQGNQMMRMGVQGGGDIYYMTGYSVNDSGFISLPVLGDVKVEGLTIGEVKENLDEKIKRYFKEYFLSVRLGGLRFAALGEFNAPGKHVILQNQATIFEAIAQCHDLNMVADRENVRLIRQYPDGSRVHTINLLDQSLMTSPLYFIQPNDVIYVEPLRAKSYGVGVTGAQTLTTIISAVSSGLALVIAVVSLTR